MHVRPSGWGNVSLVLFVVWPVCRTLVMPLFLPFRSQFLNTFFLGTVHVRPLLRQCTYVSLALSLIVRFNVRCLSHNAVLFSIK